MITHINLHTHTNTHAGTHDHSLPQKHTHTFIYEMVASLTSEPLEDPQVSPPRRGLRKGDVVEDVLSERAWGIHAPQPLENLGGRRTRR